MDREMQVATSPPKELKADDLIRRAHVIDDVFKRVMKVDVHYGKLFSSEGGREVKPSLFKPGAEKLLVVFQLSVDPIIEDLCTADTVKYRVIVRVNAQNTGQYMGSGVGECSSDEEKYRWRKAVCKAEFDETLSDRKRIKHKKSRNGTYTVEQVRTEPADIANTVLKMAKKRALVDAALTVTGASDMFQQDLEDLPPEVVEEFDGQRGDGKPPVAMPGRKSANGEKSEEKAEPPQQSEPAVPNAISDPQIGRMFTIAHKTGWTDDQMKEFVKNEWGITSSKSITRGDMYERIVGHFQHFGPDGEAVGAATKEKAGGDSSPF